MTTVVSLWGGPGVGKSTVAAYLYARLKALGRSVEQVREHVKEWAWGGRPPTATDQVYLFGKQLKAEADLLGRVDFLITDCPAGLVALFTPEPYREALLDLTAAHEGKAENAGHSFEHRFVPRVVSYMPEGRFQDETAARAIDASVLREIGLYTKTVTPEVASMERLIETLTKNEEKQ